jgi:hypothetical protein
MSEPTGKWVVMTTFVDANLTANLTTGRSCTGMIHMFNKNPISWYSKRQNTAETAPYGSEFVSARIAVDQIIDLPVILFTNYNNDKNLYLPAARAIDY